VAETGDVADSDGKTLLTNGYFWVNMSQPFPLDFPSLLVPLQIW